MKLGILALSLLFVTAGQAPQDDVKKEIDKLQGSWAVTSFNGEAVPAEAQFFLVMKADKYEQWTNGAVDERGTFKLDLKTKPLSIDLIIAEGTDAGKTQPGVYEWSGPDSVSVGLATPGSEARPSAVSNAALQVVLKRTK